MQLVAYGAQDIYLTGNPQITFFKVVYSTAYELLDGGYSTDHGTVTLLRAFA